MTDTPVKNRLLFPDMLRGISTFAVMMIHVSAGHWGDYLEIGGLQFNCFTVYNSLCRFSVPVFVMVSGMTFLDPEREISRSYLLKKLLRLVAAFVFWSALYAVYTAFFKNGDGVTGESVKTFVKNLVYGHYHLWFLYMIAGLYLITPFLRKITENKRLMEYFLILCFIFAMFFPTVKVVYPGLAHLNPVVDKLNLNLVMGYAGYFVLGYYLYKYPPEKPARMTLYNLGILGVALTLFFTLWTSLRDGRANAGMLNFLSPAVALTAAALFVFFMRLAQSPKVSPRIAWAVTTLSKASFGMYLVHDFFNILFNNLGFTTLSFDPRVSPLVITVCVFAASFLTSWLIGKIPRVSKYIS